VQLNSETTPNAENRESNMELIKLMKDRRSIRKYKGTPVSLEKVYQILEADRYGNKLELDEKCEDCVRIRVNP